MILIPKLPKLRGQPRLITASFSSLYTVQHPLDSTTTLQLHCIKPALLIIQPQTRCFSLSVKVSESFSCLIHVTATCFL